MKVEFIRYSVGLECRVNGRVTMVKAEYNRTPDGAVLVRAVSGRNLARLPIQSVTIDRDEWDARPRNAYNETREAIWTLGKLGLQPVALEF